VTVLLVTGTGTDVGKTVTTAAVAVCAPGSVAVVKPAQTGVGPGEGGDLAEVTRLSGRTDAHEYARYPEPLSPHHAAARSGLPYLDREKTGLAIAELAQRSDLVLVEGAGGLLVPYDDTGWTILDLARDLRRAGLPAELMLVTAAGLGTLNHTALTVRAIRDTDVPLAGIVVGSWPQQPGTVERCNLDDLAALSGSGEIAGALPAGLPAMADFPVRARAALSPRFGGTFDWARFRAEHAPEEPQESAPEPA
jgi:dethiobiotin synthetase